MKKLGANMRYNYNSYNVYRRTTLGVNTRTIYLYTNMNTE